MNARIAGPASIEHPYALDKLWSASILIGLVSAAPLVCSVFMYDTLVPCISFGANLANHMALSHQSKHPMSVFGLTWARVEVAENSASAKFPPSRLMECTF